MEPDNRTENKFLRSLLDLANLNVLVCDIHTQELLYANKGAMDFAEQNGAPYAGRTCYEYLMHRDAPCADCNIFRLGHDDLMIDEIARGGRYWRRKGQRMDWDGREAYVEYVEDISAEMQNRLYEQTKKENLRATLSRVRVGIVVYEYKDGHITVEGVNKAICDLLGIDEERAVGIRDDAIMQLTHPDDFERVWGMLHSLCVGEREGETIFRDRNKATGRYIWVLVRGRSYTQSDGAVRFYVTYTDITAQKELGEKLRQSEESLNAALRNSALFYWKVDLKTGVAYYGDKMREYFNLSETQADCLNAWTDSELIHKDDIADYRRNTLSVFEGNKSPVEWDFRFYDGRRGGYVWGHICYTLISDAQNRPATAIALMQNIHDAKELEDNFVRAETQNGIWTWELDLETKRLSKVGHDAIERNWPMGDVMEDVPESIIKAGLYAEESHETVREAFGRTFRGEHTVTFQAKRWSPEKQRFCWYEMIFTVVDDGVNPVRKAVCTSRDISAEKTLEARYAHELKRRENVSKDIVCDCCVNLTKREVVDLWFDGANVITDDIRPMIDFRTRIGLLLDDARISDEDNEALSPERLILQYEKGVRSIEITFFAKERINGRGIWIDTEVKLFINPENDVVAFFYNHNSTLRVMSEMIAKSITSKSYDFVGYIDVKDGSFILEDYDWSKKDAQSEYPDYDQACLDLVRKRTPAEEQEAAIQAQLLETVKERLEKTQIYTNQHRYVYDDGSVGVKAIKYAYGDDDREYIVVTRSDITDMLADEERKKRELEAALEQAESASKAKSDFLSIMSHDMRTPLNAIMGLAALTMDEAGNEAVVRDNLQKIRSSGDFLLGLVNDILDMAKIEDNAVELHMEPYCYTDFLSTIKTMFDPLCRQNGIKFEFEEVML